MPGSRAVLPRPPSKNPDARLTRQAAASSPAGTAARRLRPRTASQVVTTWPTIIGSGAASSAWPPQASPQVLTPDSAAHSAADEVDDEQGAHRGDEQTGHGRRGADVGGRCG